MRSSDLTEACLHPTTSQEIGSKKAMADLQGRKEENKDDDDDDDSTILPGEEI